MGWKPDAVIIVATVRANIMVIAKINYEENLRFRSWNSKLIKHVEI